MKNKNNYVWAFQYCYCIHESSYATFSVHETKKGAEIAMEFHKNEKQKEFEIWQKEVEEFGFKFGENQDWRVFMFLILK